MKNKKYILFDLDGTLTDPGEGITNSVKYALERFGFPGKTRAELECFIGPPLGESFERYYGMSHEDAVRAIDVYREYFAVSGKFENEVYPGIPELLSALVNAGKTLVVATSKPWLYSEQIVEHFGLADYFLFVMGSELDGTRVRKEEVVSCALEKLDIADLRDAVMIGDRSHDIIGAKANALDSIGVLYGYGTRAELVEAGADAIVSDVAELRGLLI